MKKKTRNTPNINDLTQVTASLANLFADKISDSIYADNSFLFGKPVKFWYKPILIIRVPYFYIDRENNEDGDGRKGLFFGWYPIEIGKRKVINENYKKEMDKYKKEKGLVYFVREGDMKFK
jgi:hypothetical protein